MKYLFFAFNLEQAFQSLIINISRMNNRPYGVNVQNNNSIELDHKVCIASFYYFRKNEE